MKRSLSRDREREFIRNDHPTGVQDVTTHLLAITAIACGTQGVSTAAILSDSKGSRATRFLSWCDEEPKP